MQELERKYKKLKHKIFDEDVDELPEPIENPAYDLAPEDVIDDEVTVPSRPETRQHPVRRADILNYKRFGFFDSVNLFLVNGSS
jgi:hypothetical protein